MNDWTVIPLAMWNFLTSSGPSATGDFLVGLSAFIAAIAAVFADPFHIKEKINHEKYQNKMKVAKEALILFNDVRGYIQSVRRKEAYDGEMQEIENLPSGNQTCDLIKAHPFEGGTNLYRLNKKWDHYIVALDKLRPEFKAMFSEEKAFFEVKEIMIEIREVIASFLGKDKIPPQFENIHYYMGEDDPISTKLNSILSRMEKICEPYLRGEE